jgi:5-(carboxyamino)imidazole ribonucleotide synthase
LKTEAAKIATQLLEAFDYVGVMAVEMFETKDGQLLVNEIAPRVHNSGHWTIDGCVVSQFEQHIRAVAGWPLGDPSRHSDAVMTNLLGPEANAWREYAGGASTAVHLYGKGEARAGRKMGHVTRLYPLGLRPEK